MKKISLILMIIVLTFSSFNLIAFANEDYDEEELSKYDGYAKSYYEHLVDVQTHVAGKYTNNVEYVKQSREQIVSNAQSYFDRWSELADNDKYTKWEIVQNLFDEMMGAALTIPDALSTLAFWKNYNDEQGDKVFNSVFVTCVISNCQHVKVNQPYVINFSKPVGTGFQVSYISSGNDISYSGSGENLTIQGGGYELIRYKFGSTQEKNEFLNNNGNIFYSLIELLSRQGVVVTVTDGIEDYKPYETNHNPTINTINNYIQNGSVPQHINDYQPRLMSKLICPSGEYKLYIEGSKFKLEDGTYIDISYDGKAVYKGENCILEWVKPVVDYDEDDNVIIEDDKGKQNIEDKGNSEECDGVLCFLSSIVKAIGKIATAIGNLGISIVKGILEGIGDVLKLLFVPSEDFWNENLNELKSLMFQEEIDEIVAAVEGMRGENSTSRTVASNDIPMGFSSGFKDMAINIMGVDGVIVDADTVNSALNKIHSWVRGFFYALLVIYNVNQIYRLIRGTTMFEGSGVKQVGGKANDN